MRGFACDDAPWVLRFAVEWVWISAMRFFPMILMAFGAMIVGCERHDFHDEEVGTRQLHVKDKPKVIEHSHEPIEE